MSRPELRPRDLPADEPLVTVEDDYPETLEDATRSELASLWGDLEEARRNGINTAWSIRCGNIAFRIVRLSRLVGATRWDQVGVDLLLDGVYERLHQENGLEYEPIDWDRIRQHAARRNEMRSAYRSS